MADEVDQEAMMARLGVAKPFRRIKGCGHMACNGAIYGG
jgi:hypothetical protein